MSDLRHNLGRLLALLSIIVLVAVSLLTWQDWLNEFFYKLEPYRQVPFVLRPEVIAAGLLWCAAAVYLFVYWLLSQPSPDDPP
jgi:hypothetical protein